MSCRTGEDALEAQLDTSRLRDILRDQDIAEPEISERSARKYKPDTVYLGLYRFSNNNTAHRELALQRCVRAQIRATLKWLEATGVDPRSCMNKLEQLV
jgi:hypothetical protein